MCIRDRAKPLLIAGLVGGLYDFIVASLGWWNENFTSRVVSLGCDLADKAKMCIRDSLIATPDLKLQLGDRVTVVGKELAIAHTEKVLGNQMKRLNLSLIHISVIRWRR